MQFTEKEFAGKVLALGVCVKIVRSAVWKDLQKAVEDEDPVAAIKALEKDTEEAGALVRKLMWMREARTLKIPRTQDAKRVVYKTLAGLEQQLLTASEGGLEFALVSLECCPPGFADGVRQSLEGLASPEEALEAGLQTVLAVDVKNLVDVPVGRLREAISAVARVWHKCLGAHIGGDFGLNVLHMLQLWENVDLAFT
eukprot:SAG11_NODE_6652_length_1273_cov_1.357751_1_plen_198_part_00